MAKHTTLSVSDKVKGQLITYARSHKIERRLSLRAQIILDWIHGLTYKESSKKNQISEPSIAKWRKRFERDGLAGLIDAQRPGTPAIFTEADRNRVIHLACQRTESGTPRYSQHQIAEMCQMSQSLGIIKKRPPLIWYI